jgi:hypothetical protein
MQIPSLRIMGLLLPLLLLLLLLTMALCQPSAIDQCELQNELYVSIVALCTTVNMTGPGVVGMLNILDGQKDVARPISIVCFLCLGLGRGLVNILAV